LCPSCATSALSIRRSNIIIVQVTYRMVVLVSARLASFISVNGPSSLLIVETWKSDAPLSASAA